MKLNGLNTFLFSGNDISYSLPFFRITISIVAIMHVLMVANDFDFFYSDNGLMPYDLSNLYVSNHYITIPKLLNFVGLENKDYLLIIYSFSKFKVSMV